MSTKRSRAPGGNGEAAGPRGAAPSRSDGRSYRPCSPAPSIRERPRRRGPGLGRAGRFRRGGAEGGPARIGSRHGPTRLHPRGSARPHRREARAAPAALRQHRAAPLKARSPPDRPHSQFLDQHHLPRTAPYCARATGGACPFRTVRFRGSPSPSQMDAQSRRAVQPYFRSAPR